VLSICKAQACSKAFWSQARVSSQTS
jgi:hypothetical protein